MVISMPQLLKYWHWLIPALTGLVLLGIVLSGYIFPERDVMQDNAVQSIPFANNQEPITPIPLELNLDARKVALGRRLFHDPQLSSDNTISCAYCHNLSLGGVDGLPRSFGVAGKEGKINTPTVFNSGFNASLFWDGHAKTLDLAE